MSLLSDFVAKPYLGLGSSSDVLSWQKSNAEFTLDGTNTGAASNPALNLKNAKSGVGNGGLLRFYAMNDAPASFLAATIKGALATNTAGSEDGKIDFLVPKAGISKTFSLDMSVSAFIPLSTGTFAIGANTFRWSSFLVGNSADTIKGDLSVDGTGVIIQASSAHPLQLKSNGNLGLNIETDGNLTIPASRALRGDFSNATHSSRTLVRDATAANATYLGVAPGTAGSAAGVIAYGTNNVTASPYVLLEHDNTTARVSSQKTGAGTSTLLQMVVDTNAPAVSLEINGDVRLGSTTALTTSSTAGFPYLSAVAGVMTGVPTSRAGFIPVMIDSTNHKIGIYSGGAWKWTPALT